MAASARRGLGRLVCVLAALVLAAMAWTTWWLDQSHASHARAELVSRQTLEADLWSRMLLGRLEAQQRLLGAVAQGMDGSLLDKPDILDALMRQDGSMLGLFEALHVALPAGTVSHHSVAVQTPDIGPDGLSALRHTIAEGKPTVATIQPRSADQEFLRVLLTVPIRRAESGVSGALAATVSFPLTLLLPDPRMLEPGQQYLLLDRNGTVLAASGEGTRLSLEGGVALTSPLAETQLHDGWLVTRLGLPLPQWQVVVARQMQHLQPWLRGLPAQTWAWLLGGSAVLVALAAAVLWRWPVRRAVATVHAPHSGVAQLEQEELVWEHAALAKTRAVLEGMPSAVMLEVAGAISMVTPQAAVLLGYFRQDAEQLVLQDVLADPPSCKEVLRTLQEMASFDGMLQLRKKDGSVVPMLVSAWVVESTVATTVWQLRLPWRVQPGALWSDAPHAGRDSLTGLPGREAFMAGLQSWVAASVQARQTPPVQPLEQMPPQGCLLFADLDHLGLMNEATSREMGNRVLTHVGRLIASYVQPLGDAAHLGGDEFAVLLPGVGLSHAQGIGQAVCDAVWHWQPSWQGERHWVSISIGIVAVDALRHTPEQALHAADMACYEAKRRGRGQVAVGQIGPHDAV